MKPQCLPQISQISQIYADKTPKQQNSNNSNNLKQPVFLCEIMQLAAFLCVISAICGKINRQEYSIETPMSPADLADYADKQQNNRASTTSLPSQSVFLCGIMQLAVFLCVICAICGRIITQEYSIYQHK